MKTSDQLLFSLFDAPPKALLMSLMLVIAGCNSSEFEVTETPDSTENSGGTVPGLSLIHI